MSSVATLLITFSLVYSGLMLVDYMFRSCKSYGYVMLMHRTGLEIKLFQLKWYTQGLNRLFTRLGSMRPTLLGIWFSVGAYAAAILLVPAMVLLVRTLVIALVPSRADSVDQADRIVLQPVLPGVNLPTSELGYYFVTLLVCSVIHEAGHAIAAVHEDVRVLGFGVFVLFVLPAAFVDLPTDQLLSLRPFQQLRVFAAGIWHNVVLAAFAYLLLFSIPVVFSPLYEQNVGVSVTWLLNESPVRGPTGLKEGDVLTAINDCQVKTMQDWRHCLSKTIADPVLSVCMAKTFIDNHDTSVIEEVTEKKSDVIDCCGSDGIKSSLCFLNIPSANATTKSPACLPVRTALETSAGLRCNGTSPCVQKDDHLCFKPSLSNHTRLLQVKRRNEIDFLFVGTPSEVYATVHVSDFVPIFPSLSARLPPMLELLSHYVASFSGALAVLNVVPCFMLDGQHMTRVLVDIILPCYDKGIRSIVTLTFTIVGTVLLAFNIMVGVWQMF